METTNSLSLEQCCSYYHIETSFVRSLNEHGLIELMQRNESYFIAFEQLSYLEKYMHMHFDLEVNMEGLEVVAHLLNKVQGLQSELKALKNEIGR